jgi:uncharacterized coiled-coil protein SlyX
MSEERLNRFETRMETMAGDVAVLKTDVAELKTTVASNTTAIGELRIAVTGNTSSIEDLRRHMGVLHEEVLDRIRAIGEDDGLRREMRAGFAELRQILKDHIIVGDAADRNAAARLDDHERRIRRLEGP